jgi:hypothetical protein
MKHSFLWTKTTWSNNSINNLKLRKINLQTTIFQISYRLPKTPSISRRNSHLRSPKHNNNNFSNLNQITSLITLRFTRENKSNKWRSSLRVTSSMWTRTWMTSVNSLWTSMMNKSYNLSGSKMSPKILTHLMDLKSTKMRFWAKSRSLWIELKILRKKCNL